jgi:hypothetical protein
VIDILVVEVFETDIDPDRVGVLLSDFDFIALNVFVGDCVVVFDALGLNV